jgi:FMN phosphatase YigB (HAD superfamily)
MQVVFDLDGVLRDFNTIFHDRFGVPHSNDWNFRYKNKGVYDWVKEDYSILVDAEPTPYFQVIKKWAGNNKIDIWSHQPDDWVPYTEDWLAKYLGGEYTIEYLTPNEKYSKLLNNPATYLVDDYPLFPDYSRIILVDYEYNQDSKSVIRVQTPDQLRLFLGRVHARA